MEAIQIAPYSKRVSGMLGTRVALVGGLECRGRLPRSLALSQRTLRSVEKMRREIASTRVELRGQKQESKLGQQHRWTETKY